MFLYYVRYIIIIINYNVYTTRVFGQAIRHIINGGGSCSSRAIINDELYINFIVVINNAKTTYEFYAHKHYT